MYPRQLIETYHKNIFWKYSFSWTILFLPYFWEYLGVQGTCSPLVLIWFFIISFFNGTIACTFSFETVLDSLQGPCLLPPLAGLAADQVLLGAPSSECPQKCMAQTFIISPYNHNLDLWNKFTNATCFVLTTRNCQEVSAMKD